MSKIWTIKLSLVCMLLSLMLVVSCGKKKVDTAANEAAMTEQASEETETGMGTEEAANEEAMALAAQEEAARKEAERIAQLEEDFITMDVHFDYDSSVIVDSEIPTLEAKGEWLRANPDVNIIIEGHCDERGTTEYNLALGDRRAARVKSFLMDLGISASRIQTISYGEERPVAQGHMESAWAKNRRAHFMIK